MEQPLSAITQYVAALGLGSVVTLLVQLLKRFGVIPDGYGGTVASVVNVVIFLALLIAGVFGFDAGGDEAAQLFAVINNIATLIIAILSSVGVFGAMRGANVVGFRKDGD